MTTESDCARVRELLPELALGIAAGEERAWALEHLAACPSCRRALGDLTEVADELLALGPVREPPVGFESRVIGRLFEARPRRWRWLAAAAAAVLVLGAAGGVYLATRADRELADRYRQTLAVANGEYFSAAPLVDGRRRRGGHVFGYQGSTSWIFIVVSDPARSGVYRIVATTEEGDRHRLGDMNVSHGSGSWGSVVPVDYHDLEVLSLAPRGGPGSDRLAANL
jgi:putative zinc finger protein